MKHIYKYALIASAAFSFAACNDMIESSEPAVDIERTIILTATREDIDPNTRSVRMDDGTTWWSPKEEISVFYGSGANGGSKFTSNNTTLAETTEFEGSISLSGNKEFWAVYPYSTENSCDGSSIVTVIPSQQTGSEDNFANNAFPAVGKSDSLTMPFWNVCGGIKFFVSRPDIKTVTFSSNNGEALAGMVKVSFGSDGKPDVKVVAQSETKVTLIAPDDGCFKAGKYYYMSLLPVALNGGFAITFETATKTGTFRTDKDQTIRRSILGLLKNIDAKVTEWEDLSTPGAIDLGLSVKWAAFNLGAKTPEDYGDYFAWGEVTPKDYYWDETYRWSGGSVSSYTKYCTNPKYGDLDGRTILDPEDDAAQMILGGLWRMPTIEECKELINNCDGVWTDDYNESGVSGYILSSRVEGFSGNSIFIPAAGRFVRDNTILKNEAGLYWSSSLRVDGNANGLDFIIQSNRFSDSWYLRRAGHSIRPVWGKFVPVSSISLDKTSINMDVGDDSQLFVTVVPSDATVPSVVWVSADTSIATVSQGGVMSALSEGSTTVTAYSSNGISATCNITVKAKAIVLQ